MVVLLLFLQSLSATPGLNFIYIINILIEQCKFNGIAGLPIHSPPVLNNLANDKINQSFFNQAYSLC